LRFNEFVAPLEEPQNVIEISPSLDLEPSRLIVKWESLQEELNPWHSLISVLITILTPIAAGLLLYRAGYVKFYHVSELEHVNQGVDIKELDILTG
jgi:hypothetical protein